MENPTASDSTRSVATIGIIGSDEDVTTEPSGGIVLMGGSTDVDDAIKWMITQSGGGDFIGSFAEPPNLGISFIICRFSMNSAYFSTKDPRYYVRQAPSTQHVRSVG